MEKDVYCYCPKCDRITNGTGSGSLEKDAIWCECKNNFTMRAIGRFKPLYDDNSPERWLYVEMKEAEKYF